MTTGQSADIKARMAQIARALLGFQIEKRKVYGMADNKLSTYGETLREVHILRYELAVARNNLEAMVAAHRSELAALESQLAAYRAQVAGHEARLARERAAQASTAALSEKLKNIESLESPGSGDTPKAAPAFDDTPAPAPAPSELDTLLSLDNARSVRVAPDDAAKLTAISRAFRKTPPKQTEDLGRSLSDP